jgi:cardiolipin synthase A/B
VPLSEKCELVARRYKLLSLLLLAALYCVLIRAALDPPLPNPITFYSNQNRDDLRLVLKKIFAMARSSIDITMYAATDEELLQKLHQKAAQGLAVRIRHDPSTPLNSPLAEPIKTRGLMHRKIVVIDDRYVLLGSANMTTSSLLMHDNLSVGFDHPQLARFLKNPSSTSFDFTIQNQRAKLWLLPDPQALPFLQQQLRTAQTSIFIAMFTLTHPALLQTIIEAHQRSISVTVAVDHYAARGASKKAVQLLQSKGISVIFSQGLQLLHHKWAYIDRQKLVLGSTNWTKAAFTKNQDCLLFIDDLSADQRKLFDQLSSTIVLESNDSL